MGIYSKLQQFATVLAAAVALPAMAGTPTPALYEPKVEVEGRYQDHLLTLAEPTSPQLRQRIFNGSYVPQGKYPWMAFLLIDSRSQCGASLINEQWAITAAHCTAGGSEFTLAIGRADLEDADSGVVVRATAFTHPQYGASNVSNDIALLKLEVPIPTSYINEYASLATASQTNTYAGANDRVQVMGYGQDENGQTSTILKENVGFVQSFSSCNSSWGGSLSSARQICMTASTNTVCKGDSGGPLFFNVRGDYVIAGLVSFGSSRSCDYAPAVFTRVANYLSWVQTTIAANTDQDDDNNDDGNNGGGNDDNDNGGIVEVGNGASGTISLGTNETNYYQIDVPANATLVVNTSGSSGDADLFVNFGSLPNIDSASANDCASTSNNSTEQCELTSRQAGTYYVAVTAYRQFSNVRLSFNYDEQQDDDNGDNGGQGFEAVYENISGGRNSEQRFDLEVPAGASNLKITLTQGTGTAQLQYGIIGVHGQWQECPQDSNRNPVCSYGGSFSGSLLIKVVGPSGWWSSYRGATLKVTYDN